jgi:hypothetical protein
MDRDAIQTDAGTVDDGSQTLLQSPKLLGKRRLKLKRKLQLGTDGGHSLRSSCQLLSTSDAADLQTRGRKPGRLALRTKNIRPKMSSRNPVGGDVLKGRPPLRLDQSCVFEPIRNGLLADAGPAHELRDPLGKSRLGTGNLNGATERSNVRFLHGHGKYTRFLVDVNKEQCLTDDKEPCIVLQMPEPQRKERARKSPKKRRARLAPAIGPDGLAFGQRVQKLMTEKDIGQTALARMCSDFYRTFVLDAEDCVQQQHIFNIISGQESAWCMPLIAEVFDVRELWLQLGIGPRERK